MFYFIIYFISFSLDIKRIHQLVVLLNAQQTNLSRYNSLANTEFVL